MTAALEGGEWSASRPGRTLPPRKTRYRRLGGPQGRSGRAENLVHTGIRSRTVQPVVSRYTDWVSRPTQQSTPSVIRMSRKFRQFPNKCSQSFTPVIVRITGWKWNEISEKREEPDSLQLLSSKDGICKTIVVAFFLSYFAITVR